MSINGSLTCINPNISQKEWLNCLCKVDKEIIKIENKINESTELIVISLPYSLNCIKKSMEEAISRDFARDCFDIIIDFMIPNKKYIQKNTISNNSLYSNEINNKYNKWTSNKHDELIYTESIIIINRKTGLFQSIPRNVIALIPDYNNTKWQIKWKRTTKNNEWIQIYSIIANNIANKYLSNNFVLNGDWSQKIDFSDTVNIGYLCDSEQIAYGTVLRQNSYNSQIFIHFNTNGTIFGKKFEWIQIPNPRLCESKKTETTKVETMRDLRTFYSSPPRYKSKRKRNDTDLERAIAASLQQQYIGNNINGINNGFNNYYNGGYRDNDEEDINRAIAASLDQEYAPNVEKLVSEESGNNRYKENRKKNGNKVDEDLERGIAASLEKEYVSNLSDGGDHNKNGNNGNYVNFEDEDDLLQKAIEESLKLEQ